MSNGQISILTYWTIRYFAILCVSLAIIALSAMYWIMDATMNSRLKTAGLLGQEIVDRVVTVDGQISIPADFDKLLNSRFAYFNINKQELSLIITNSQGEVVFSRPELSGREVEGILSDDFTYARDKRFMAITTPIFRRGQLQGQVTLLQSKRSLTYSPNEIILVAVLLLTLILCGWLTLYLLSRKLSDPIRKVAGSAMQIANGQYEVDLNVKTREREIHELVGSFKNMAIRLKQLEDWRELSLAGVTHELKTPITSIKGLLMAVREGVVAKEEAEEFLEIALKETDRLERMVADLLNYNAFSSGSLEVREDRIELENLVSEIVYQWRLGNEHNRMTVNFQGTGEAVTVIGDALRLQQIMVNLLNNALQAAVPGRPLRIDICLKTIRDKSESYISVEVSDNGSGIPREEQPHIFERFYRGERKKRVIRGLGLGLTLSRLLARSQHGELTLGRSCDTGSTFMLKLPWAGATAKERRS